MNLFSFSGLLISISSVVFGIFVFIKNKKSKANQLMALLATTIGIWGVGGFKIGLITEPFEALFWWRLTYIGIIFIPVFFYHFTCVFLGLKKKRLLYLIYLYGFFFLVIEWIKWGDLFFGQANITLLFNSLYWVFPLTPLFVFFVFSWFAIIFYSHYELYKALKKSPELILQNQIKYFFLATAVGFSGGGTCFLPCFGINLYPIFNFTVPLYPAILAFAITKYHLFEIRVLLTELLVGMMGIILAIFAFVGPSLSGYTLRFLSFFILFLFLIFGYYLIRATHEESKRREEAERLAEREKELAGQFQVVAIQSMAFKRHAEELAREYERLNRAKTEFVAIVSHQLRTPLSSMKGYLSMILEGDYGELPPEATKRTGNIFKANERLIRLVNTFLDLSKIETGEIEVNFEKKPIENVILEAISEMKPFAEKKNLYLRFKKLEKPLPEILIDEQKIREILLNVLDNAIKYTQKGGITVEIERIEDKNLQINVKDTGEGLTKEESSKLFESFSRGTAGERFWVEGVGLGLYVSRKFIELHNGKIWAESKGKGKGTTIYIELPMK